ncbi:MAG: saccharopine dehydrogenase C-terminal domain-containing protein [Bacteroidota bacterium]
MTQKKVLVLGAGLVGKAIAIDLSKKYDVACADMQMCALETLSPRHPITVIPCDFKDRQSLTAIVREYDLIIGAVPGHLGYRVLETVIRAGKSIVDISFFPEDPFSLHELALAGKVTAVVDCGVAPGLCNLLAGHHHQKTPLRSYECLVGGLPVKPEWPFHYKAGFSPADVLEEYTRPARMREDGKLVTREALSGVEPLVFDEVGELEAFNTDGLRTLLTTMESVPDMKEKTLRFPGHAELMRVFRESGFLNNQPVEIKGVTISPVEFTARLLFPLWKLRPGEEEFTLMRVTLETGDERIRYTLFDRYDKQTGVTSMARTTGYTCAAVADLILQGKLTRCGILAPEQFGADEHLFHAVMEYLAGRNILCKKENIRKKKLAEA